jgi:hypothetical protein
VRVRVTNLGAGRKLPYEPWGGAGGDGVPRLTDAAGRACPLHGFGADRRPAESARPASLAPACVAAARLRRRPAAGGVGASGVAGPGPWDGRAAGVREAGR